MAEGQVPDRPTLKRLYGAISGQKKSPSACANMQKGSTENGTVGQIEYTASGAENQEEVFQKGGSL